MKRNLAKRALALPFVAVGGWLAYSKLFVDHAVPLPEATIAKRVVYTAKTGVNLNYYVDKGGNGRPLVLIHAINAAASAYEVKPLFEHYRGHRPVYALELPGFGFSDRPQRTYTPQYFAETILDFIETQVQEPVDIIALSLSCEFIARAALGQPELFRSLTFISPTGFGDRGVENREGLYAALSNPLWGQALFDLIATKRSIVYFLKRSFVGPINLGLVDYAFATAHQPGARYAPLQFVSGNLFTPHIRTHIYEKLQPPTLVIYDQDGFSSFTNLPNHINQHSNWQEARIVPSLGLPHFEKLSETAQALDAFWQTLA